jgi:hypothetical protein
MSERIDQIVATLAAAEPDGLTSAEVAARLNMTSYNASGTLSKLAAYGKIASEKIDRQRYRWKLKPMPQPQRVAPLAKPGELLKRINGVAPQPLPREASDPAYLAMIRQLPCLKCGMDPCGEAAHVRMQSGAHGKHNGIGRKPDDRWAAPLCACCHREDRDSQHRVGELVFWHRLGSNPLLICERLYAARGDLVRMRAIALLAIAEASALAPAARRRAP